MSPDTLAKLILVLAAVCLVLIAIGLVGSVVYVNGLDDGQERER